MLHTKARNLFFEEHVKRYFGMSAEVKELIATCETCRKFETSNPNELLMPHDIPSRPWEQVGVNLFELDKKNYMITVDYYSNFWKVDRLTSTTAVILKLKNHFARHGCPDRVISDNSPQFLRIPEVFQGIGFRVENEQSRKEQRKWESQCKGKCSESCEKSDSKSS